MWELRLPPFLCVCACVRVGVCETEKMAADNEPVRAFEVAPAPTRRRRRRIVIAKDEVSAPRLRWAVGDRGAARGKDMKPGALRLLSFCLAAP